MGESLGHPWTHGQSLWEEMSPWGRCGPMALSSFENPPRVTELVRNLAEVCWTFQPHLILSLLLFYLVTHSFPARGPKSHQAFHSQALVPCSSLQHLLPAGCLLLLVFLIQFKYTLLGLQHPPSKGGCLFSTLCNVHPPLPLQFTA